MTNHPHEKITPDEIGGLFNTAFMKVAAIEKAVKGFRITGICPINQNIFTEEDFLPANLEMVNAEDPEPENELAGIISPSPDVMTISDPPSLNVIRNEELTPEDSPNPGPSCSFLDIAPLPKNKKTDNPTLNKRGKMHSEVITSTPKKIMLEEIREKRFIDQKTKEARERGKLRNQKGKEPPKRKRQKSNSSIQKRKKTCRRQILSEFLQKMRSRQ
jgi:hypothetical protein